MPSRLRSAFDAFRGPRSTADAPASGRAAATSPMKPIGRGGGATSGGYVITNERSAKLVGTQRFVTFSDILANTSIVAAGTRYFLNILSKATWTVSPAVDDDGQPLPGAQEFADLVESAMGDMSTPWYRVIRRAAMYRYFGFSVQEWTAKRRTDGRIGLQDIEARPQVTIERWDVDDSGTVQGVWQRHPSGGDLYLPRGRLIHLVDDALEDSPEGLGLFRHVVRSAERLRAYEELEEVAFETDLRGIPIARAPLRAIRDAEDNGDITPAQANKLLAPLNNFINNHIRNRKSGLLMDSETFTTGDETERPSAVRQWDVELLQGSSTSQEAVAKAIERLTWEMATVIGAEGLLLGRNGGGSMALGKVRSNDFYMTVSSSLTEIGEQYTRDFVRPLGLLNGVPQELWPTLGTDAVQFRDVEEMSAALRDLATAGATLDPRDPAVQEMRDLIGLSRTPQELLDAAEEDAALMSEVRRASLNREGKPDPNEPVKPGEDGLEQDREDR